MSKTIKTFNQYLVEQHITNEELSILNEGLQQEWTPELEAKVDAALDQFVAEYADENGNFNINSFNSINAFFMISPFIYSII